jgi:release factor glutamine methyltransferase
LTVERVWTPVELIRWTEGYLAGKGFEDARLNAELLLAGVLRLKRLDLYLQFDRPLTAEELAEYKARLRRRVRHEPLQYIEGTAAFRNLTLKVDGRVLIPRPETESLAGEVLKWAAARPGLDVLDLGTGSGAIALSLRQEGAFGRVVATDISRPAVDLARANADRNHLSDIDFRHGSFYDPVEGETFDVIVSNPPYVAEREREALPSEVRDWEPAAALFAGDDGLAAIRSIVRGAPRHLRAGGLLAMEIGAAQSAAVIEIVREAGGFADPLVRRDFSGRDRLVLVEGRETRRVFPTPAIINSGSHRIGYASGEGS